MIEWNTPWLLLIAVQPFLILLMRRYIEQTTIKSFVNKKLQDWVIVHNNDNVKNKVYMRNIAYYLAWILFSIAAAGPQIAEDIPAGISDQGKDIMVVLDISQSMHTTDLSPSRLRLAHKKIEYLINNTRGNRIGIITYAAKPHLYIPLSYDESALNFYLRNLKFLIPPSQGSQALTALQLAKARLSHNELGSNNRSTAIILITDGDTSEDNLTQLKKAGSSLLENNIPIFTLLMSTSHGEAIPGFNDGWLNINGRPIISRPTPEPYQKLSDSTNAQLEKATTSNTDIDSIISRIEALSNNKNKTDKQTNWRELHYWFLFPAILLLFANMFPYRFINRYFVKTKYRPINAIIISLILVGSIIANSPVSASQQDEIRSAYKALLNNEYIKSRELYSSINGFEGLYGEAVSSYRLADYTSAIRLFERAVLSASTPQDTANTLYNLGNSYFKIGNYSLAASSFQSALLYQPQHEPSIKNKLYAEKAHIITQERKKLLALTNRAGKGPRSARAADNVTFTDNNNITLDNSESENLSISNASADSNIVIPEFIILRGIEFAKSSSADKNITLKNESSQLTSNVSLNKTNKLEDDQTVLWRRIFEIEEGYPAPLDKPETLPGVQPW